MFTYSEFKQFCTNVANSFKVVLQSELQFGRPLWSGWECPLEGSTTLFFSLLPGDCSWKLSLFKQTALLNSVNLTWLTLLFVLPAKISLCQIQSVSTGLCNSLLMWRSQSEQPMLNYKPITLIVYLNQRQIFYISIKLFLSLLNTAERGAKLIKPNFPWD